MSNKLELNWLGKGIECKLEPRILIENQKLSYSLNSNKNDIFDNVLIHGDNLLALKSIEQKYIGKVKCIYIDPPYNTGAAFAQYDDNREHSLWLSLMKERISILHNLLTDDGSIWISIDDDERDYLKILCDEIFGRHNFVASIIWKKKGTRSNDARWFSDNHDYILVFAKNKEHFKVNRLPRPENSNEGYTNPDNDPRGPWASGPCHAKTPNEKDIYEIVSPSGKKFTPPPGTSWRFSKEKFISLIKDNHIWFGKSGDNVPRYKRFLSEVGDKGFVPLTIWDREEVGDNQEAKKEVKQFNSQSVFATPKPERLIQRILTIATNEGDIVLDSFLGSGTTCAVAHKMHRRWIGIELEDTAYTHCKPRIDLIINGKDSGGISKLVDWKSGGGYKFYELAATLINTDALGEPVINKQYNPNMLAVAIALHENFTYCPSQDCFWKQSKSTENSYLFVTTQHVTDALLSSINSSMLSEEFLIIACKSFDSNIEKKYKNIMIKKIPEMILNKCEFGKDNYNLNIIDLPKLEGDDNE